MSTKSKLNVFIISSWYPSTYDPYFGLFVKQTATYLSEHFNITVLNVNNRTDKTKTEFIITQEKIGFTEITVDSPTCKIGIFNFIKTIYLINKIFKEGKKFNGKPDIIHLQILSGLLWFVYFKKNFSKIPFVVSEHWSKYFNNSLSFTEKLKYKIQNCLLKKASAITVVSEQLKQFMTQKGFNVPLTVIPNPIDSNLFKIIEFKRTNTFVHISCFDEKIKNISGIIQAVELLNNERDDFELILIGNGPDYEKIVELVKIKKLKNIRFTGALKSEDIVDLLNQSCALIMNSYKETFGIPVIESWLCGTPVISTPVGIAHNNHPKNFITITEIDNPESIVKAMINFLDFPLTKAQSEEMRKYAIDNFSKEIVMKKYIEIYLQLIR